MHIFFHCPACANTSPENIRELKSTVKGKLIANTTEEVFHEVFDAIKKVDAIVWCQHIAATLEREYPAKKPDHPGLENHCKEI